MDIQNRYLRIALFVLAILLCLHLIAGLRPFFHDVWLVIKVLFIPFLAAMIVSYLLQPLVEKLASRKVPRGAAILIIYFGFALLFVILVVKTIPAASRQFTQLAEHLPELIARVDGWLDGLAAQKRYLPDALRIGVERGLAQIQNNVTHYAAGVFDMLSSTLNAVFVAFVVPFLVYYMLKDGKAMGRAVVHLFPKQYRDEVQVILVGIDDTLGSYVRGQMMVMTAVGVLGFAGYLIIGLPYALLMAIFLAVMDVVPYLGPFLGAAPALILAFTVSPLMALKVLIVNVLVQQCEGNLISPAIMGRTLHLHPMAIVAAILVGGEVGGMLGLICAVPVLAVAKVVYTNVREFRNRQTP
ncbi:AI-2E family transporter [Alicyclobacillus pomorum]|uniref:AI-2E family transporter n=1 Tax=Alicyclobacillus pomorum TaxID=204470 RepID=UPI0003F9612F|nr:AI-2E family transporter [Alicyclobacillus pomorum]